MKCKFNPFTPTQIASDELFTGRDDELAQVDYCLQQTIHGNAIGFFLTGERGIGKSSLLLKVRSKAQFVHGVKSRIMLTVLITLDEKDTVQSFAQKITSEMHREKRRLRPIRQSIYDKFSWIYRVDTKWLKIIPPFTSNDDSWVTVDTLTDQIKFTLSRFKKSHAGFLLLIDEVERASEDLKLGALLKRLVEQFRKTGLNRATIGLAGQLAAIDKLRGEHAAAIRSLRLIKLERLRSDESRLALNKGLALASLRTGEKICIDDGAANWIVNTSDGYPHFLQQLAASALETDTDGKISLDDAFNGAFGANGAIDQLGYSYFEGMFTVECTTDIERYVLNTLAKDPDTFLNVVEIADYLNEKQEEVSCALSRLIVVGIVERHDVQLETYKVVSRAFATWIQIRRSQSK